MSMRPILAVAIEAEKLPFGAFLTNSIFVAALVTIVIMAFAVKATSKMTLVPHRAQNMFEFVVEFLYNQVEGIVGKHIAPKAFPLLATIFLFVLVSNWFGLVPFVGTMGWAKHGSGFLTVDHVDVPLLRPATADLNMTLGIALCFMAVWAWLTFRELGFVGFIKHTFAPKGVSGALAIALAPIFIFVGIIELVSIAFRPVSLSLRLFGNLFAGESLLHTMLTLGDGAAWPAVAFICSVVFPLPFYFLELLVGLLQAMVYSLLCAVYIQLSTSHEEH